MIEVDGETYTAPHSFDWPTGSIHTIGVASPQSDVYDPEESWKIGYFRYLFAKWSDGGAQSHSVTASSETTVFIANFIEQVRSGETARAGPPHGGTARLDPPSDDGFYTARSYFKAFAEPAEGFSFFGWGSWGSDAGKGSSLASNPLLYLAWTKTNVTTALFTRRPLTKIDTNVPGSIVTVDGSETRLPANFAWEAGSTHTLGLSVHGEIQSYFDGERLIFDGWSDGGDAAHDITVSGEPTTITASFRRQVLLDAVSHEPGTVAVEPGESEGDYYDFSSSVQLTAQPDPGFEFVSWYGDLSGSENPKSLLMDSRKWVRAIFIDVRPPDDLPSFRSWRLISGEPVEWSSCSYGPCGPDAVSWKDYWRYNPYLIAVPTGATQLAIHLATATPGTDVDLYANYRNDPYRIYGENNEEIYVSEYLSTGPGGNKSIIITPESSPPLEPGPYFIAVHAHGGRVEGTLTAK